MRNECDHTGNRVALWRCEIASIEGRRPDFDEASWLHQGLRAQGGWDAIGRWFTNDPATLAFYARDISIGGAFRVVSVEVDAASAEAWRVRNNPEARAYSRDWESEYFLPREVAERAAHDAAMTNAVACSLEDGPACQELAEPPTMGMP